jgi:VCBS repeat-containing protein
MNYRNRQKPSYSLMLALEPRMVFDGAIAVPDTAAIAADVAHVTGNVLSDGTAHDTGTGSLAVQGVAGGNPTVPLNTGVNTVIAGTYGSLDMQANGSYNYTLNNTAPNVLALAAGQQASDTFTYSMHDAANNTSITTLTIDITGGNDAPTAVADSTHITASAATVTGNLLTNDTDPDAGDTKTVSAISTSGNSVGSVGNVLTGTYGTLTVNADGSYSYALDHSNTAAQALPVGKTLTDTFNYTMKDSGNLSSSSTLIITIDGSSNTTTNTVGTYSVVRDVAKATEIVFLDGALLNLNLLESSVPSGIEIVVLDPTGNEVQQITNFLAEHTGYSAVNIVSHGDSGELFLGQSVLSDATLAQYSQQLEVWKNSLAPGADLLIYGSDVASGTIGQNFITELARLTGTTVAASTDTTGSANYGGNWILEAQIGVLDVKAIDFGTTGWDGEMTSVVTDTIKPKSSEITFVNNQLGTSTDTVSTLVTAQTKAAELIAEFLQRPDALEQLFNLFNGQQTTASKQWLDTARNLLQDILDGNYSISVKTISNEQIGGVFGAFTANGPNGQPTIFMNQDWLSRNPATETISRVLIEELGHSLDHALNGNIDTAGDEGEAFAAKVLNFDLTAVDWQRIASEDDHSTIYLDGQAYEVEDAAITFTKVYQGTPSSWSQEAQNITTYATAVSGSNFKFVSTDPNAAYFSGNNVSGDLVYKDANGNTISISGVVSRLIKTGSTVEGLFFYATGADGLINGIGDTSYIFCMDPTKFTGSTQYGTSSDPVDTALNSFIVPNSAPVANNDSATVTEDSLVTGNVLTNDTDANADSLTVSAFTISGQAGPFVVGTAYVISGVGSLTINSNGSYSFTPTANYSGAVPAVTYTASDGKGGTATANLSLTITPVNDPPTSTNDSLSV